MLCYVLHNYEDTEILDLKIQILFSLHTKEEKGDFETRKKQKPLAPRKEIANYIQLSYQTSQDRKTNTYLPT